MVYESLETRFALMQGCQAYQNNESRASFSFLRHIHMAEQFRPSVAYLGRTPEPVYVLIEIHLLLPQKRQ